MRSVQAAGRHGEQEVGDLDAVEHVCFENCDPGRYLRPQFGHRCPTDRSSTVNLPTLSSISNASAVKPATRPSCPGLAVMITSVSKFWDLEYLSFIGEAGIDGKKRE